MKFGVREICNVVFRAKSYQQVGSVTFKPGQPVLYLDSAKTSTLEGAATTVYATGGRGNTNLVAWEGEKTLTFTVEDALISPMGLSVLSGAGLIKQDAAAKYVHVHTTVVASIGENNKVDLKDALKNNTSAGDTICKTAPIYVMEVDEDSSLTGQIYKVSDVADKDITLTTNPGEGYLAPETGKTVMVDFYAKKRGNQVSEIQIDAANFAGYYYVEADTLFRKQIDGVDAPVNITLPNVKIQSNFSFSMASSGDPSTFTFTMDAFPGYTYFDNTRKVLCVMQIVEDAVGGVADIHSVMLDKEGTDQIKIADEDKDSYVG